MLQRQREEHFINHKIRWRFGTWVYDIRVVLIVLYGLVKCCSCTHSTNGNDSGFIAQWLCDFHHHVTLIHRFWLSLIRTLSVSLSLCRCACASFRTISAQQVVRWCHLISYFVNFKKTISTERVENESTLLVRCEQSTKQARAGNANLINFIYRRIK